MSLYIKIAVSAVIGADIAAVGNPQNDAFPYACGYLNREFGFTALAARTMAIAARLFNNTSLPAAIGAGLPHGKEALAELDYAAAFAGGASLSAAAFLRAGAVAGFASVHAVIGNSFSMPS